MSPTTASISVVSYNIHHGRGSDGVIDLPRIAKVYSGRNPTVVGLQEVDQDTGRSGGLKESDELGRLAGMKSIFAEAMPYDGGQYGEGLLAGGTVLQSGGIKLPAPAGKEPRSAACAKIELDGLRFWVFTTHLDHTSDSVRGLQVKALSKLIDEMAGDEPAIVMGDFNMRPETEAWGDWFDHWTSTVVGPTYPSEKPDRQIDYIFVRPANRWSWNNAWIGDEPVASDHAPIGVNLTLSSS